MASCENDCGVLVSLVPGELVFIRRLADELRLHHAEVRLGGHVAAPGLGHGAISVAWVYLCEDPCLQLTARPQLGSAKRPAERAVICDVGESMERAASRPTAIVACIDTRAQMSRSSGPGAWLLRGSDAASSV